jgi:L-arabinose isomerase
MPIPHPVREFWFLTGSQLLYGDDILRQVAEQSRAACATLDANRAVPAPLVWKDVLVDAESIRNICLDASRADMCAGVIIWMHTFSPAREWIAGLRQLTKPLLHLHTQAEPTLPWATIDMDFMNLNQSAHGDREVAFLETRLRLRRKTAVGHVADPQVATDVGQWQRAALGWDAAQSLRLARFGDNMRGVADTDGDKVEAQAQIGISVVAHAVNDLVARVDSVTPDAVEQLVHTYDEQFVVAESLAPAGPRRDSLRYAARLELGLRTFLDDGRFTAFTTNFEDLGGLRQLPGISVQRLMAEGYGFGGEGDWKTAALLRIVKAMGDGLPGGTSFMEDYTYHWGPGEPKILGAHMLEVCPSITADKPSCEIHPLGIGGREDPVRLVFTAAPGPGRVIGLVDLGDRFRLVANEIELVPPDEPLPRLPVARAVWKPAPTLRTSATAWLTAGGPHHTVLTTAVSRETLEDFAEIAGIELAYIDADTDIRRFTRELQWQGAYHRLAQPV